MCVCACMHTCVCMGVYACVLEINWERGNPGRIRFKVVSGGRKTENLASKLLQSRKCEFQIP